MQPGVGHDLGEALHRHARGPQDHAGDGLGDELGHGDDLLILNELAVGEEPGDFEADAGVLDGEDPVGHGGVQGLDGGARVEGARVDHLVAAGDVRVEPQGQGAIGADHPAGAQPQVAHHRHGGGDPAPGGDDHGDLVGAQAGDGGHDPLRDAPVHVEDGAVDVEGDDEPVTRSEPGSTGGLQGVEVPHPVLDEGVVLLVVQGPTAQHAPSSGPGTGLLRGLGAALMVLEVLRGATQAGQGLAGRSDPGLGVDGRTVARGLRADGAARGTVSTGGVQQGLRRRRRGGRWRGAHDGTRLRRRHRRAR